MRRLVPLERAVSRERVSEGDRASWEARRPALEDRASSVMTRTVGADRPSFLETEADLATTLVIMESGAEWPIWVKELQRRAPNSMVEVQPSSESADCFAARVLRRIGTLQARGVALLGAVYAASSPASEEERAVRRRLCGALLAALSPSGELVLSGSGWSTWGVDARSREDLLGLAGDLSCDLTQSTQSVSVRFSDPDPLEESGVHKAGHLCAWADAGADVRGARESA